MSYVRTTDQGSDVYVFGSLTHLECSIAWRVAVDLEIEQFFNVPFDAKGGEQKTMYGHLMFLRDRGVRVPDHVFRRLMNEIDKYAPMQDYHCESCDLPIGQHVPNPITDNQGHVICKEFKLREPELTPF